MNSDRPLRVVLASVGLGRVQRGFERWAQDLLETVSCHPDIDFKLFRSKGPLTSAEAVPPVLWPITRLMRALPIGAVAGHEEYKRDSIAFALCLIPELWRGRFDVIHLVDPPLAVALGQLRRFVPFSGTLLFTDGCGIPPGWYPRIDHLHHVGLMAYQEGLAAGVPESCMTLVPSGVHAERFTPCRDRASLRERYGVPDSTFVILVVSAVKRDHKRVDHAIEEVSALSGDVLLWIDGNPEDPEVPALAEKLLPSRHRITHVPSEDVAGLYQLADVLVHTSLEESFGLTIVEAMCCGLPVLTHDNAHFRWLVNNAESHVDMQTPGMLAARLEAIRPALPRMAGESRRKAGDVAARFGWKDLSRKYVEMYYSAAKSPRVSLIGAERSMLAARRKAPSVE